MLTPHVADIVHYVSYGTPGGEYASTCRAAVITEVSGIQPDGQYVVGLCVLNPTGQFFNRGVNQSELDYHGGTWHWPNHDVSETPSKSTVDAT